MSTLLDSLLPPDTLAECVLHDPEALPDVRELDLADWLDALLAEAVSAMVAGFAS
jgi:hypothetical protein